MTENIMIAALKKQLRRLPRVRRYVEERERLLAELEAKEAQLQDLQQQAVARAGSYSQDGLITIHNHDFMEDPEFASAYAEGVKVAGADYLWHWRVYIGMWAASTAVKLEGDFVECGVNVGFMSTSIMHYIDWDAHDKTFYLLDTFSGIDPRYLSNEELEDSIMEKNEQLMENGFYVSDLDRVKQNFSKWENICIIPGSVPETLTEVEAVKVAFLHIDMNNALPECAALEYFWDKLSRGAIVLLDDYAYDGYHHQKNAIDELVLKLGVKVLSLPTGQGLIVKP